MNKHASSRRVSQERDAMIVHLGRILLAASLGMMTLMLLLVLDQSKAASVASGLLVLPAMLLYLSSMFESK